MKYLLFVAFFALSLFAEYKVGDKLTPFALQDQFGKELKVDESLKLIILATTKDNGKIGHSYFEDKSAEFFDAKKVIYISDMSSVPSLVLDLFMMGKFKKYTYRLGLLKDDKVAEMMPKKDEMLSVIYLDNLAIKDVKHTSTKEQLAELVGK